MAAWILFIFGVLKDVLQPYGSVIGTFTLAGVGVIGIYILGIMTGRRQSENRSSRKNQVRVEGEGRGHD